MSALEELRSYLASANLSAFIIPSEDAHQSEYIAEHDKRRAWLTGFTGSAGLALVTKDVALLWTDGRYFLQAETQLSADWTLMRSGVEGTPTLPSWIRDNLPCDARVGFDPFLCSIRTHDRWTAGLQSSQALVPVTPNPCDALWRDQPDAPSAPIMVQPVAFAGATVAQKLEQVRQRMRAVGAGALVVSALDEVCWLLNLRGCGDIPFNPVAIAYAVVTAPAHGGGGSDTSPLPPLLLFVHADKVGAEVRQHLATCCCDDATAGTAAGTGEGGEEGKGEEGKVGQGEGPGGEDTATGDGSGGGGGGVEVRPYQDVCAFVAGWGGAAPAPAAAAAADDAPATTAAPAAAAAIWLPSGSSSHALRSAVPAGTAVVTTASPVEALKAVKNGVEQQGMRDCHVRDAAALVTFLHWLETTVAAGNAVDECSAADELARLRSLQRHYISPSFATISGADGNGAVIHYKPQPSSAAPITGNSVLLLDSGGQYRDGTTDVTRTVHLGQPSGRQRRCFTRVLQGHIALATAVFPSGTPGHTLDVLARTPLWEDGLDYRHGTGHGVGSFLNVHEGPHGIGVRARVPKVPLVAGMTVTDEPGYYEDGAFGIRIESVLIVQKAETINDFGGVGYLCFENITFAPIQTKFVDASLLSPRQLQWLNHYNQQCLLKVGPLLQESSPAAYDWLCAQTQPLLLLPPDGDSA